MDLESRIRLARLSGEISAIVTLDIAKAYDSVEYGLLISRLVECNVPNYIVSWVQEFLSERQFFLFPGRSSVFFI